MTEKPSHFEELTDAIKSRMTGLSGTYAVSFLIFNWKLVLIWVSNLEANDKISGINALLYAGWCYRLWLPIILAAVFMVVQYYGSIFTSWLDYKRKNKIDKVRLKIDETGEKFLNELRLAVFYHYLNALEQLAEFDPTKFDGSVASVQKVTAFKNIASSHLNQIKEMITPENGRRVINDSALGRNKIRSIKNHQSLHGNDLEPFRAL